jgi:integrase
MRLTKDTISKLTLPPGKGDYRAPDDEVRGLYVRIRSDTPRRVWVIRFPDDRWQTIGDVTQIEPADARKIARRRFAEAELGGDPIAAKAKAQAEARQKLGAVSDQYLDDAKDTLRTSTWRAYQHYFAVQWGPFRSRPLRSITRADVADRLRVIKKEHGVTSAARARSTLSALYAWAITQGRADENPVIGTLDPGEDLEPRDRTLTPDEIRAVWASCRDDDFGKIVKLLLLTACRRDEIGGLKWDELDLDAGTLSLPKERTKSGRALKLRLPEIAVDILRSVPQRREFVFGNRGGAFSRWSYEKMSMDKRIAEAGHLVAPWRLHDLRRTARTGMGKLGVKPHIAELVLNHVGHKIGVGGTYDKYDYGPEIAAALALWADHIRSLVDGTERKVLPLRPTA